MKLCLHGDFIYYLAPLPNSSKNLKWIHNTLEDLTIHIITKDDPYFKYKHTFSSYRSKNHI